MSDARLLRLFERHYPDAGEALRRFDAHVASLELPFVLKNYVREMVYPVHPRRPQGVPSSIYYFVPGSGRGSYRPNPADPQHPSYLNTCDAVGLNLGCPVRMLRAMDAITQLSPADQQIARVNLKNTPEHLSAVEEILWSTDWKSPSGLRRGPTPSSYDWAFEVNGVTVLLEAKFRRSDWPRLSERGSFLKTDDGFLSNALHKFPYPKQGDALHVVGITTFDTITEEFIDIVGYELQAAPQIDAVVFRSMLLMTHVLAIDVRVYYRLKRLLAIPKLGDFPLNYIVPFNIEAQKNRVAARPPSEVPVFQSKVFHWMIKPQGPHPYPPIEHDLYRLNIRSRSSEGEPEFFVIPNPR